LNGKPFIYIYNLDKVILDLEANLILKYFSSDEVEKLLRYKHLDDIYRTVIGRIIVIYSLLHDFNVSKDDINIKRDKFNKPYLVNSNIFFNVSHSENLVVCIIAKDILVGVDVEKITLFSEEMKKFFMSEKEINTFGNIDNSNFLTELWTIKESFLKAIGIGLNGSLKNAEFKEISPKILQIIYKNKECNWWVKSYFVSKNYKLSICQNSLKFQEEIFFVDSKIFKEI